MEEIVQKYGMVVITRAGNNPEKFIYESDILTKHKVFFIIVSYALHCIIEQIAWMYLYIL